jgi:hypothetical protein
MKNNKLLFTLILCVLCFLACKKETEVSGEIFVVTEGAGNYKLGLVQVSVIPEEIIKKHLESVNGYVVQKTAAAQSGFNEVKQQYDTETQNFANLERGFYNGRNGVAEMEKSADKSEEIGKTLTTALGKLQLELAGKSFFENLPLGITTATTNADGKFMLKVPKAGKYAIVAYSQRKVADKTEEYYWMNWLEVNGEPKAIMFSNNNMTKLNPPEAILKTSSIE